MLSWLYRSKPCLDLRQPGWRRHSGARFLRGPKGLAKAEDVGKDWSCNAPISFGLIAEYGRPGSQPGFAISGISLPRIAPPDSVSEAPRLRQQGLGALAHFAGPRTTPTR